MSLRARDNTANCGSRAGASSLREGRIEIGKGLWRRILLPAGRAQTARAARREPNWAGPLAPVIPMRIGPTEAVGDTAEDRAASASGAQLRSSGPGTMGMLRPQVVVRYNAGPTGGRGATPGAVTRQQE